MHRQNMSRKILLAALLGTLQALPGQALANESTNPAVTVPPAGNTTPSEPPANDKVARGLMLLSQNRMIFSPCRDRSYNAVEDVSPDGATGKALKTLGLADGVPLYVEVFGESASGMLRMQGLNMAQQDARCYAPRRASGEWRAAGQDWALTLFEGKATLQQTGREDMAAASSETRSPDHVEIRLHGTSTAKITLQRQLCHDNDKQRIYAWTAEIDLPDGKLGGCAWRQ